LKHFLLFLLTLLATSNTFAQLETPPVYLTLSGGINHTGILGIGVEVPVQENIAVFGDAGIGGWGFKLGLGASYYLNDVVKGGALNLAFYYAGGSGNNSVDITLENQNMIPISLKPTGTLNFTYAQNWKLGYKSKFALIGGYALATSNKDNRYDIAVPNTTLDDFGKSILNILHPNGLILGVKFMIGLGQR